MPLLKQNWRCCRCVQFKWKKNYNQGQEKSEDESDSDEDCEDKDGVPMTVRSMKVLKKKWGVFAHEQISVAVAAMLDNGQNDRTSIHMQRYGYCNCSKSLITSHTAYLMMQRVQSGSEPTGQKHGPPSHLPVTELWASPSHLHFAGLSPSHLPFIKPSLPLLPKPSWWPEASMNQLPPLHVGHQQSTTTSPFTSMGASFLRIQARNASSMRGIKSHQSHWSIKYIPLPIILSIYLGLTPTLPVDYKNQGDLHCTDTTLTSPYD